MKTWILVAALASAGGNCDDDPKRSAGAARGDAVQLLRSPVICDGNPEDGYVCGDNKGGVVSCPRELKRACKLVAGKAGST